MAESDSSSSTPKMLQLSELPNAKVHITEGNRMRVEFKIDDLIKKLLPSVEGPGSCGGCRGCMGCGMIEADTFGS